MPSDTVPDREPQASEPQGEAVVEVQRTLDSVEAAIEQKGRLVRDYALIGAGVFAASLVVFAIGLLPLGVLDGVGYRIASLLMALGAGLVWGMGYAFWALRKVVRRL